MDQADSLFAAGRYTKAWSIYDSLFRQGEVSEGMLLKMAYIKEGLDEPTEALYFLNHYYTLTTDRAVLDKMQTLANEESLKGYDVGDKDFFRTFLLRYHLEIRLALISIVGLLGALVYRSVKKRNLPIGLPVMQALTMLLLLILNNGWWQPSQAIIAQDTFLMTAPSAAAEVVQPVDKGHRVEVIKKGEVWTKIRWEEQEVYIRAAKLRGL